jgi:hypothetical protein
LIVSLSILNRSETPKKPIRLVIRASREVQSRRRSSARTVAKRQRPQSIHMDGLVIGTHQRAPELARHRIERQDLPAAELPNPS